MLYCNLRCSGKSSCFVHKNNDIYNLIINFLFLEIKNKNEIQYINHRKYKFVTMIRMKGKERHQNGNIFKN